MMKRLLNKLQRKTAKLISNLDDFSGDARLYKLSKPLSGHMYVIVSAAYAMFSGPETYIFPANEKGEVTSWGELDGSYRGGTDHARALRNAGYEVKE
jgi:hypothetical protein